MDDLPCTGEPARAVAVFVVHTTDPARVISFVALAVDFYAEG